MVLKLASVCASTKIFFSETAWPIKAKFYMKHLQKGKGEPMYMYIYKYINNPGHMTKMASMSI